MVGRVLLAQFQRSPLSARVFRGLRLAVVTNRNLARVYDAMGYDAVGQRVMRKEKERADAVEAVLGELVVRLHVQKQGVEGYRRHLDEVLATMLQLHFAECSRRADMGQMTKGPLSVAFNPFECLPEEELDEDGQLVVREGTGFESERAHADLVEEYEQPVRTQEVHHFFLPTGDIDAATRVDKDGRDASIAKHVRLAMLQLDENHILRTSSEIFEVFKIYGMAVLSERMSLSLAMPYVSLDTHRLSGSKQQDADVTAARLTRQRQLALSVANLAQCAASLGIAVPLDGGGTENTQQDTEEAALHRMQEEHGRANTLRAFVGFHSAIATTSTATTRRSNTLVNAICKTLYNEAFSSKPDGSARSSPPSIPDREPLLAMMRSVGEARMFMSSKTCDDLHGQGERPESAAMSERKKRTHASFSLRRCDSETLDDLFEALAKEQDTHRKVSEPSSAPHTQRKKKTKKKSTPDFLGAKAAHLTGNLERFLHRRFLYCLEEIIVLFAQRKTEACRAQISLFEQDLEPCADQPLFRKWEVSTSTLTLAMRDSFYRLLLHDICQFHAVVSSSKNTRDGTRITQLRLPLHYTWGNIGQRITTEEQARS